MANMHTLPLFHCQSPGCSATYQRKEHLNRHAACHDQGGRFPCPYCNSTLVRRNAFISNMFIAQRLTSISDLLRRHIRKYHPEREPLPSRTPKACRACHARKERCDGESPCSRCRQRKVTCSRTRRNSSPRDGPNWPETPVLLSTYLAGPVPDTSRWSGQEFIDIYFREFHPIWRFLHRGTFRPAREPCVLLQSMVMIGLWIKGGQEDRNRAMTFHHKLLSAIQGQRVSQMFCGSKTRIEADSLSSLNGIPQSQHRAAAKPPGLWRPTRAFSYNSFSPSL